MAARRYLRRQDSQRRQTGRTAYRAADQVRAGDQSENGQTDRRDYSSKCFGQSRSSYPMNNPRGGLRTDKTAVTSDNGLNGAQRLNGALAAERFERTEIILPEQIESYDETSI